MLYLVSYAFHMSSSARTLSVIAHEWIILTLIFKANIKSMISLIALDGL